MGNDANGQRGVGTGRVGSPLQGRKLYIPQMSYSGAAAFAAAFRSVGFDAEVCPDSDSHSMELGRRHTSGEECLPACVTLGAFLKIVEQPGFDPKRTAFLMTSADGPCRFGQYVICLQRVLRQQGQSDVQIVSPHDKNGYADFGAIAGPLLRTAWVYHLIIYPTIVRRVTAHQERLPIVHDLSPSVFVMRWTHAPVRDQVGAVLGTRVVKVKFRKRWISRHRLSSLRKEVEPGSSNRA